jgi:regulator of RNase E activity RraA
MESPIEITWEMIRSSFYVAVVCDVLDQLGFEHQSPRIQLRPLTTSGLLAGRCKTTLWEEIFETDPQPYALELQAVDSCKSNDVVIVAADGSTRAGTWGELLSRAAMNRGSVGTIVDGAVRDVHQMSAMKFPCFAKHLCPYDSLNRMRVIDVDVSVELDGVRFEPDSMVMADRDGVVVIPSEAEQETLQLAWKKIHEENEVRRAIEQGMSATDAFRKYGVL